MKLPNRFLLATLLACAPGAAGRLTAADSPELVEARARLTELYRTGSTDDSQSIKNIKAEIARLEYLAKAPAEIPPKPVSIDFPGGTLASFVVSMNQSGGGFNIVGEKADLAIDLPSLSLRNANPSSVATAVSGILMPRGYMLQPAGPTAAGQAPVYYLRKLMPHEFQQAGLSQFQSFQLGPYLEHQSVDDIVGAIRAAWDLDPAHTPTALRLKFHPPTGILLVSGPNDGIFTVQTVLAQLRKGTDPAKSGPKPPLPAEKK